jgi:hypothetical protein
MQTSNNQLIKSRFSLLSYLSSLRSLGVFESEEEIITLLLQGSLG